MCFSAAASFTLSGVLIGVGGAAIARNPSTHYRMFAAIPLIFGAQQATEGVVWLTIDDPARAALCRVAVMLFLGFALVLWPAWLPLALRLVERDRARRRVLTLLSWFGGIVGAGAAVLLGRWEPVAAVAGHSIRYEHAGSSGTAFDFVVLLAYVIPTIAPLFISTLRLSKALGVMLVVALIATALIERDALTSVWCFFAAILSSIVYFAVGQEQQRVTAAA